MRWELVYLAAVRNLLDTIYLVSFSIEANIAQYSENTSGRYMATSGGDLGTEPDENLARANRQVPLLRFAWGIVALAAAAAAAAGYLGYTRLTIVAVVLVFIGAILLWAVTQLMRSGRRSGVAAGIFLLWSVAVFFVIFLGFTVSAFATGWPCPWAAFLEIREECSFGGLESKEGRISVRGQEVIVFAGGPNEANPGCPNREADACVQPQHGGRLLLDTADFVVVGREGDSARTNFTISPKSTEQSICFRVTATTGACETRHAIAGAATAIEVYALP